MNIPSVLRPIAASLLLCLSSAILLNAQTTYPRNVLIEEFTSVTCKPCAQATPIINKLIAENAGRVVAVRYHMNFPTVGDPWYAADPSDNDGRATYYGVNGIPASRVDRADLSPSPINESDMRSAITAELASASSIKLNVTHTITGNNLNATVKATANASGLSGNYVLRVAVVEKHIIDSSVKNIAGNNGETEFYDVMRVMLPGSSGQSVTLTANQSKDFPFTVPINAKWKTGELFVVAWVQDEFDPHAIMQAGASSPTSGVNDAMPSEAGFMLQQSIPNPASTEAVVRYNIPSSQDVRLELQDMTGRLVRAIQCGRQEPGAHSLTLGLNALPTGSYRYTLVAGEYRQSRMLMVVR